MTNLPTTIKRLRENDLRDVWRTELEEFASAFLDTTPIDETWLESLGFEESDIATSWVMRVKVNEALASIVYAVPGRRLFFSNIELKYVTTRGQLTALLFSLGVFE